MEQARFLSCLREEVSGDVKVLIGCGVCHKVGASLNLIWPEPK